MIQTNGSNSNLYYNPNQVGDMNITSSGIWTHGGGGAGGILTVSLNSNKKGISAELYFKFIKKNFGILEGMKLNARMKKLERAFSAAVDNGQVALGEKLMNELVRETRESMLYAKGVKHFIEREVLHRHKFNLREGHISDTKFEKYTRVIPKDVLAKKKKTEGLFDGYVIYHYWNEKETDVKTMSPEEKERMRDPVLFGVIAESDRLYFIADWDDEYCTLSFEEMIDVIGGGDEDNTITRHPKLNI